ncbi:MAG: hypothetical protein KJP10_06880 [Gammaproteobacteria bacterium]|nr:hypothetical protein [Gammaproteobacteria bacterium]
MLRRLFFLFPDTEHTRRAVDQLIDRGFSTRRMYTIAKGVEPGTLPAASARQKRDTKFRLEKFLWNAILVLFLIATTGFIASLVSGSVLWAALSLFVVLLTFISGEQFAVKVPDVTLSGFTDALEHGEVLLMVDVPVYRVAEIEGFMHHHHPEAVVGGASWSVDALGI